MTFTNKIYFYSTKSHYQDKIKLGRTPMLKIGETIKQKVQDRINQQDTTSNPEKLDCKAEFEATFSDKEYRVYLFSRGYKKTRNDKKREWIFISVEDAIYELERFKGIKSVNKIAETRELYEHQKQFLEKIISTWSQWKEFLLFSKCRSGKSTMVLSAIVKSGVKVTLGVSRYKSPEQSWVQDSCLKNFENVVFININEKGYEEKIKKYLATEKQLFLWGCIQSRKLTSLPCKVDLIVYDEAHHGYDSDQWQKLHNTHNCKALYVTGTAYKLAWKFNENNSFVYSYFEEQLEKNNKKTQGRVITSMKILLAKLESSEYKKVFGNAPSAMKNIFNIQDGKFLYPSIVKEFVSNYFGNQRNILPTNRLLKNSTHLYLTLPSVAACHEVVPYFKATRFAPLVVTGDTDKNAEKINEHIEQNPCGSVILTRTANVLGVTACKIDTVINCTEGKSLEFYVQFAFRGGSGKQDWTLIDFCPERCLQSFRQAFLSACDTNKELSQYEFTDFFDISSWYGEFKSLNHEEICDILSTNIEGSVNYCENFVEKMNADILKEIECSTNFKSHSGPHLSKDVNSNDTNGKTNKKLIKSLESSESLEKEINSTKEQVLEYMKSVPLAVFHCIRNNISTSNVDSFLNSEIYINNTGDVDQVLYQYFQKVPEQRESFSHLVNDITVDVQSAIKKDECETLDKLAHSGAEHQVLPLKFVHKLYNLVA